MRESLEIGKHNLVRNSYNDPQFQVITNAWHPILRKLQIFLQKQIFKKRTRD